MHNVNFECEFCDERFTAETYGAHRRVHINRPLLKCDRCNGLFTVKSSLDKHPCPAMTDNSKKTPLNKKKCNVCNEEFTSNQKYNNHRRRHKTKSLNGYVCSFCGLRLKQYTTWVGHLRTHTGEKPYVCDICGVHFRAHGTLRNHRQLHTGKKINCELCPKKYTERGALMRHMRSHNSKFFFY